MNTRHGPGGTPERIPGSPPSPNWTPRPAPSGYTGPPPGYVGPPPGYAGGPVGPPPGYAGPPPGYDPRYNSGYVAAPPGQGGPPPGYYAGPPPGQIGQVGQAGPPGPPPWNPAAAPAQAPRTAPTAPPRQTGARDTVTTVISWLGAAILVLGLVFLTVQAVEHHWLGPRVAVSLAAVLCLAVIAWSVVSHDRSPDGPVAPALLTVGVIGLFSDIGVTVFGLGWIPHWAGAVLIGLVCAVGLGVARWWDQLWLAFTLVLTGGLFLAPAGIWLNWDGQAYLVESGCLVTLGVLGWAATWHRDWIPVDAAAAVVFVLGVTVNRADDTALVATVSAVVALAVLTALSLVPTAASAGTAVTAAVLTRWLPAAFVPVLVLLDTGAWTVGDLDGLSAGRWCALGVAVLTCAVPVVRQVLVREGLQPPPRPVPPAVPWPAHGPGYGPGYGPVAGAPYGPQAGPAYGQYGPYAPYGPGQVPVLPPAPPATVADAMRAALGAGLAALTAVLLSLSGATGQAWWLCTMILVTGALVWYARLLPLVFPWVFGAVTALAGLSLLGPAWDRSVIPEAHLLWLPGLFYLVLAVLTVLRPGPLHLVFPTRVACGGVLLVLGSTAVPLLARDITDTADSFMVAQLTVSVLWMLLGVTLLLEVDARVGLGVALLATAKLVLYDLAALDGLIQVAAFILCGLILLGCAAFRDRGQQGRQKQRDRRIPADRDQEQGV